MLAPLHSNGGDLPSCGEGNPEGFQFCGFCAAPLTAQPAAPVREERKVVSVLFCDLVGFTAEAAGDHARAAVLYAEAATRWREFGNVPERAYALLGQGRCLATLDKPEAEAPLREARELFASMSYRRALAETDELLTAGEAAAAV